MASFRCTTGIKILSNFKNKKMKNILITISIALLSISLSAQNVIAENFEHLSNQEDVTSIHVTGKMFSYAQNFKDSGDEEADEMLDFISTITAFRFLGAENLASASQEYENGLQSLARNFEELIVVRSKDGNFSLYVDETNGTVHELVGLGTDNQNFMVFSLTGEMDLKTIGKVASEIQMEGFNKMETIKDYSVSDVKVYPNPVTSRGTFTIDTPEQFDGGTITMYDENGMFVKELDIDSQSQKIRNTDVSPGVYVLDINKDAVSVKKKVIIVE